MAVDWDGCGTGVGVVVVPMTPPKCPICSTAHYGWQAHTFATNKRLTERLTSTEDATNNATNTEAEGEEVGCPLLRGDEPCGRHADPVRGLNPEVEPGVAPSHPGKSANRRDRAAYNAYQREYMRKRRGA
jgi:hypothetical protein